MAESKLKIINDALALTSNGLISAAQLSAVDPDSPITDDNDPLYLADRTSRFYDTQLLALLERHTWPFARATAALVQADAEDNPSNRHEYAYDWPTDALWLETVEAPGGDPIEYRIFGRHICMDYDGEDDDAPVATFIEDPGVTSLSNLFYVILRGKIEVAILRGINEDYSEAQRRDNGIEELFLPIARTRGDQQNPPRRAFKSRMIERRRSGGGPTVF